jgi:hypothetical protein
MIGMTAACQRSQLQVGTSARAFHIRLRASV